MSLLEEIKYKKCPHCGADIIEKIQKSQHTNGHWNEEMTFRCGFHVVFSPNFMCEDVKRECSNKPEVKAKYLKRASAKEQIVSYIKSMKDVDDAFKKRALDTISDMYINF